MVAAKYKVILVFAAVLVFFLFGLDFQVARFVDSPDISCQTTQDCVSSFNLYSLEQGCSDTLAHNKNWQYYKPLVNRVSAKLCGSPGNPVCVENTCQRCTRLTKLDEEYDECILQYSEFMREGAFISDEFDCRYIEDLAMKNSCDQNIEFFNENHREKFEEDLRVREYLN